jgi:glucuronoarabinoxylan endo-1,4-beta-xylanase
MKKKLLQIATAILLLAAGCTKNQTQPELTRENMGDKQKGTNAAILATATIDANTVQQKIQGFGGASILTWISDLTSDQRTKAFSTSSGIGLSILRVMVPTNSSNFAAEKPTIDVAKSFGAKVIAQAWNAPPGMMTGVRLNTASYAAYAAHLKAYNTAVGGVYAISPFNEPNYSPSGWMEGTATEVANFVAEQGSNCGAPIAGPEPLNMGQAFINTYLANTAAKSKTSFVTGHIYGATPYNLGNISKEVWMTEHYTNSSISGNDWGNAMNAAKEIHDCMNAGWSAYVWWYIRRFYGPIDESSNITKLGYVIAQYARYVRPGFNKISCTANPSSGVYVTAYKSGTKLVMVIVNQNATATYQDFNFSGVNIAGFNRYFTTGSANLNTNSFAVTGSSFGINLAPSSVTTLVSY